MIPELIPYQAQTAAEFYADIRSILSRRMKDDGAYAQLSRLYLHLLD